MKKALLLSVLMGISSLAYAQKPEQDPDEQCRANITAATINFFKASRPNLKFQITGIPLMEDLRSGYFQAIQQVGSLSQDESSGLTAKVIIRGQFMIAPGVQGCRIESVDLVHDFKDITDR